MNQSAYTKYQITDIHNEWTLDWMPRPFEIFESFTSNVLLIMFLRQMRETISHTIVLMCNGSSTRGVTRFMGEGYAGPLSDSPSRNPAPQIHRGKARDARVATVISYWSRSRLIPLSLRALYTCNSHIYSSSANLTELPGLPIRHIFTSSITRGELISQQSSLSSRVLPREDAKRFEGGRGGSRMEEEIAPGKEERDEVLCTILRYKILSRQFQAISVLTTTTTTTFTSSFAGINVTYGRSMRRVDFYTRSWPDEGTSLGRPNVLTHWNVYTYSLRNYRPPAF